MTKTEYLSMKFTNEDQFQAATFKYINNNYPQLRKLVFHVPNESATSDLMRMQLFSKGVVSGIPDIIILKPLLGIELKTPTGRQSDKQKSIEGVFNANRIGYYLCRSQKDVLDVLEKEIPPTPKNI